MGTPQIIMIVIIGMNIGMGLIQHGKPKEGKHSFGVVIVGSALQTAILWWGGFWN